MENIQAKSFPKRTHLTGYSNGVIQNKKPRLTKRPIRVFIFCGDGESRTRVQRKHSRAFYMLSSQLNCRGSDWIGNPPALPLSSEFHDVGKVDHDTKPEAR